MSLNKFALAFFSLLLVSSNYSYSFSFSIAEDPEKHGAAANEPQLITKDTVIYIEEGQGFVLDIDAVDGDGGAYDENITYFRFIDSQDGQDSWAFSLSPKGELSFGFETDYENPRDTNKDNDYSVKVGISNGVSTIYQSFSVHVIDNRKSLIFSAPINSQSSYVRDTSFHLGGAMESDDLVFSDDGYRAFTFEEAGFLREYRLQRPYDFASGIHLDNRVDLTHLYTNKTIEDFHISPDGRHLHTFTGRNIQQFKLVRPGDLASIQFDCEHDVPRDYVHSGIFNPSGDTLITFDQFTYQKYALAHPFDISSGLTEGPRLFLPSYGEDMIFNSTGTELFFSNYGGHYELEIPYVLEEGSPYQIGVLPSAGYRIGITLSDDSQYFYSLIDDGVDSLFRYRISNPQLFQEASNNDGSVDGSMIVGLKNGQFAVSADTLRHEVDYAIDTLPTGLMPNLVVSADGSYATLTFSGNALKHLETDDFDSIAFSFFQSAFEDDIDDILNTTDIVTPFGIDFSRQGIFLSPDTLDLFEISTIVDIDATGSADSIVDKAIQYISLSGPDAELFVLDSDSGFLTFRKAPDFENPHDANQDNLYEVTIGIDDGGGVVTGDFVLRVTDRHEEIWPEHTDKINLIYPEDGVRLTNKDNPSVFWDHVPDSLQRALTYKLRVYEVGADQTPVEAIIQNEPWKSTDQFISDHTSLFQVNSIEGVPDWKQFVWFVQAWTEYGHYMSSDTATFYGPWPLSKFSAGNETIKVQSLTSPDFNSLSGVFTYALFDSSSPIELPAGALQVERTSGFFILRDGRSDNYEFDTPIDLKWKYHPEAFLRDVSFRGQSIYFDKEGVFLKGEFRFKTALDETYYELEYDRLKTSTNLRIETGSVGASYVRELGEYVSLHFSFDSYNTPYADSLLTYSGLAIATSESLGLDSIGFVLETSNREAILQELTFPFHLRSGLDNLPFELSFNSGLVDLSNTKSWNGAAPEQQMIDLSFEHTSFLNTGENAHFQFETDRTIQHSAASFSFLSGTEKNLVQSDINVEATWQFYQTTLESWRLSWSQIEKFEGSFEGEVSIPVLGVNRVPIVIDFNSDLGIAQTAVITYEGRGMNLSAPFIDKIPEVSDSSIQIQWFADPKVNSYVIHSSTSPNFDAGTTQESVDESIIQFTLTSLLPETEYYIKVVSHYPDGSTSESIVFSTKTMEKEFTPVDTPNVLSTGIKDHHPALYPNPAKSYFTIDGVRGLTSVALYSIEGRLIRTYTPRPKYSLLGIPNGVYLTVIRSSSGTMRQRLVVRE